MENETHTETENPSPSTEHIEETVSSEESKPGFFSKVKRVLASFFKKLLFWVLLIVVVASVGYLSFVRFYSYSKGVWTGKIVKFSTKGWVFKTHEGQLIHAGAGVNDGKLFSVYPGDDDIQQEIREAMEQGYSVKVKYYERPAKIAFWGDTKHFIYDVDRLIE